MFDKITAATLSADSPCNIGVWVLRQRGAIIFLLPLLNETYAIFVHQQILHGHYLKMKRNETDHLTAFSKIGKSPQDFELVFQHIPIGISYMDCDFRILNMNPYCQEKTGVTLEKAIGKRCYELHAELFTGSQKVYKPCHECKVPEAIKTGEIRTFIKEVTPGFISEITIVPVKSESGEVIGLIELLRDITRSMQVSRELLESEEKYKSVIDNIGIGVSLISPNMEILTVNNQMNQWFPHIDVSKRPLCFEEFNDPPRKDICSYCPTYKTLRDGEVHESVTNTPLGSEIRHYRIVSSPIFNWQGDVTAAIEMVEDITERKIKEEELHQYRKNLEDMVKDRTERLSVINRSLKKEIAYRAEAEEALKSSSDNIKLFAYSVSHDLKNPAVSIYGLTRLLNKHYEDILDERGKNYCQQILKSSEQIAALVEMINVYISTKEMSLCIESIKLADLLLMIKEEFAIPLNIRRITWTEPGYLPEIKADRFAMLRVLRNFVDNSLKYGGGDLSEIAIGYREDEDCHILHVSDDGIGLTEEESQNIFGLFKRQKTAIGIAGSGLGLAIVKEIAEQHGGKVWSEVGLNKGITFNVSISKHL
ncbi:MAG: PAS domain-containing protein [Desulfobacterales bacterium]|nr:PAS domain-containing protein [Deltaproteobacteria bacterium]NNK92720.1 PAS domain-containing protein [Desulfobacterales bacterium]